MLKSPNLQFLTFAYEHHNQLSNPLGIISDLKVIYAQSWGPIEAIGDLRSPKLSSQQPCFWGRMKKNTLYINQEWFIYKHFKSSCELLRNMFYETRGTLPGAPPFFSM